MEQYKKPWEEIPEEERQAIRETWKHTVPEEYDVFCIGNFVYNKDMIIPGTLYVSGDVNIPDLTTHGALIVDGSVEALDIIVYNGHFICIGSVSASDVSIFSGDLISESCVDVYNLNVHDGNCIVHHSIDSLSVVINNGLLDCYDIKTHGETIWADDFICRCYEEEI